MSAIKVVYDGILRRITIQPTTEWSELSLILTHLFSLPPSASSEITLSYTDADNDTITVDTTLEIRDAIAQGVNKFQLNDGAGNWVLEGSQTPKFTDSFRTLESHVKAAEPVKAAESVKVSESVKPNEPIVEQANVTVPILEPKPQRSYAITIETEEPEEQQLRPISPSHQEKGKWRAESPAESSRSTSSAGNTTTQEPPAAAPQSENDELPPFLKVAQQFEQLCDQFRDVIDQNPQVITAANGLLEQITRNIPVDIDGFAKWLNVQRGQDTRDSYANANPFSDFPFHQLPLWAAQVFEGKNVRRRNTSQPASQKQQFGPEELQNKITQLNSMGFYDTLSNESFKELLKRYNGNVERVVEVLVQRQT
ncbi:hypothetical protein BC937DRAFT_87080 [Endogone sp. FLAS-F59071]|nr:hypothetical protein BC937DRAFT_87080 [Endogone sp. FLAS-F59071]|eukprot:RUS12764.1 hypothetical protein BC937DRAFT_87080 [Endogone sp. FLAS-F59071]